MSEEKIEQQTEEMLEGKPSWSFPRTFWVANLIELFERAAYYGTFIALTVYLTRVVGFSDIWAGVVGAAFACLIYLFPFFTGAAADRMGFRYALMLAFLLLSVGYAGLGYFPHKVTVLASLLLIAVGGAFVKPIITGTVAKSSDSINRARAYSIFYMIVNIGAFGGKTVAKPVRVYLGIDKVPLYSAGAALIALVVVVFFYWPEKDGEERPGNARETLRGMFEALTNYRFLALILITAGFWFIQGQLYASMPKYVLRLIGEHASPEWYANVNPFVVVLLVVPVTQLVRRLKPATSMAIAMALIPLSSLSMATSALFGHNISLLGVAVHPITVMMVIGISIQGLAECFLSPRYLEYASKQAPPGQEGLYLGYAHLNTFFAWGAAFVAGGFLLDHFCPDPNKLPTAVRSQYDAFIAGSGPVPEAYAHANQMWYWVAAVGIAACVALLIFIWVTNRIDSRTASTEMP